MNNEKEVNKEKTGPRQEGRRGPVKVVYVENGDNEVNAGRNFIIPITRL